MPTFTKDEIVQMAYDRYVRLKDEQIDSLALHTLNELHSKIDQWDGQSREGMLFYRDFLLGDHMKAIAADGLARVAVSEENFIHIMTRRSTRMKVMELFQIRKQGPLSEGLVNKIKDMHFPKHVFTHPEQSGGTPKQYTHRFLCSVFIDIMTTIASEQQLVETAKLLGKNTSGLSFEHLQVQVRGNVEGALNRLEIGHELTKFSRAAIAFHIVDAVKEAAKDAG